jgi:outer membrane murein-binding lipoprotein Lpp
MQAILQKYNITGQAAIDLTEFANDIIRKNATERQERINEIKTQLQAAKDEWATRSKEFSDTQTALGLSIENTRKELQGANDSLTEANNSLTAELTALKAKTSTALTAAEGFIKDPKLGDAATIGAISYIIADLRMSDIEKEAAALTAELNAKQARLDEIKSIQLSKQAEPELQVLK